MKAAKQAAAPENILYQYCAPAWWSRINSNREVIVVKKGKTVFTEGERVKNVFFIVSGKIKVHQCWGAEKQLILRFANDGEMIGFRGLGKEKVYPVTATALEDTELFYISIPFFETTLKANPGLTYALMDFYANELEETEKRMRNMAHMEVRGRLAETLLLLKQKFGVNQEGFTDVKLTKQDIASYVGTTYETISRTVSEFEKEKLIGTNGKSIAILKAKKLEDMVRTSC